MDVLPPPELREGLEKFRHLLFHLQMQCGSVHEIFRFFKEEKSMEHFEALKALDPQLMPQLLAREYVLEAKQSDSPESARKSLETALHLDPNCPEACFEYALLSPTPEAAMMWYQKCMDSTAIQLGEDKLNQILDEFRQAPWKQVEIHCYLKAKASLAEKLYRHGHHEVAIIHFEELLDWNPEDDLCLHQFLMAAYLSAGKLTDAAALKRVFTNDWSAQWYYLKAFFQFKLEGDTRKSRRILKRAFRRNMWVPIYLLGQRELPKFVRPSDRLPFKEGSRSEAGECVRCISPTFVEDEKLVWWMWEVLKEV